VQGKLTHLSNSMQGKIFFVFDEVIPRLYPHTQKNNGNLICESQSLMHTICPVSHSSKRCEKVGSNSALPSSTFDFWSSEFGWHMKLSDSFFFSFSKYSLTTKLQFCRKGSYISSGFSPYCMCFKIFF